MLFNFCPCSCCSPTSTTVTGDRGDNSGGEKSDDDQVDKSDEDETTSPPPEAEIDLKTYFRLLAKSFCNPG